MRVAVPLLVQRGIAKAKITADINDRPALTEPRACFLRGLAGRKCREHDLRVADLATHEERIRRGMEVWLCRAQRFALVRPGDGGDEPRFGVAEDKACELPAGIARDHRDRD